MMTSIRVASPTDSPQIQAIYAPIVVNTVISFELEPPDVKEMARRIQQTLTTYPWLVCEYDQQIAGYAYASKHRERAAYQWAADVSVYVDQDFRGRGVGRALYTALFPILIEQGVFNVFAGISLPNSASVGLHEAVGFKPLGVYKNVGYKLGSWHDVGWWQLNLQNTSVPPKTLQPFETLQPTSYWQKSIKLDDLK